MSDCKPDPEFKGRQFQCEATLSYCQLLTERKRSIVLQASLLTINGLYLKVCVQIPDLLKNVRENATFSCLV